MSRQKKIHDTVHCLGIGSSDSVESIRDIPKEGHTFKVEKGMSSVHENRKAGWFQLYDFLSFVDRQ